MLESYSQNNITNSSQKDPGDTSFSNEAEYPMWTSPRQLLDFVKSRPDSVSWNVLVAALALITFILISFEYESTANVFGVPITLLIDTAYNIIYCLHVIGNLFKYFHRGSYRWYLIDLLSFAHYLTSYTPDYMQRRIQDLPYIVKQTCYHLRLHRPFRFLWGLNDYYLKGSISGTLFKYWYIFTVLHIMCANFYLWINYVDAPLYEYRPEWMANHRTYYMYRSVYVIYKRFVPFGMDKAPDTEAERVLELVSLISSSLVVSGITIASLSLAISLHLSPEELFRDRVRLIMNDMKATHVPAAISGKVETFYRMYWHKQKAVSVTELLPSYPPTLANDINTDIYFEATQKSRILRDLSYQFLSEIAKQMKTVNYIPGDIIIRRNLRKFAMIYISYGDVEMLTAEDDETPILRFTRGSIMNPLAGAAGVASSQAHVCIRAATFCTAHVLAAIDIWRVTAKYGRFNGQGDHLRNQFQEHFERVKRHYAARPHPPVKYKSTILVLKRNLMALKEAKDKNGELILGRQDVFLELAGCYIMRNQPDAALTEESDSICLRPTFPCILQPASSLLMLWKVFIAVMTIVVTFVHPYNLVFIKKPHQDFRFFDFMATVVYILDIIVHLSTGAKIEEGVPVTFLRTSSQQVSSFWFVLDVVSVMPIFEFIGDGHFSGMNKICKLPKVFLVLKEMEDISLYQSDVLRFFAYCLLTMIRSWLVAGVQQWYMCFGSGYCNLKSITTQPFWEKGEMIDTEKAVLTRVCYSIYWALSFTTFTAHKTSNITMHDWAMQLFIMILLEACVKLFFIMEATYSATISVKNSMRYQYKECIENVKLFLVRNDVDPVLRHRFINYLQLCWYMDKAYSITHGQSSIHFDLPQHVYKDISALQRNKYIVCIPFMKHLHPGIVKTLCAKAHLFYTSPQEILLNTGDICNEIYVIKQGFCEIIDPTTKEVVSIITEKNHFGDVECLMRIPAYYTVRAVSHVRIYSLSRKHLGEVLATPKIKDAMLHAKLQVEYVKLKQNRQAPFLKFEMIPPAESRQIFPILRKHEPDTAFLNPFHNLGFFSITRYVFPRFTIRPDGKYLRRYEWFRAFCALLSAFIFPNYYLLMLQFTWIEYLAYFLDIAAYYDVFQRLLVAYFNADGILVYHPVSTAGHYIKGPMIADLLGCLPFEHCDDLQQTISSNDKYKWTPNTMQFLMCNRILQLYRFPAALEFLDEFIGRKDIIFVIKSIPILMVVINTMTSFLLLLSVKSYSLKDGGWLLKPIAVDFESWIVTDGHYVGYNITETPWNLLITVYYWATYEITTTGLDCFQPSSWAQLVVLICGMFFGSIMIPYLSVRVLSIRSNVNHALAAFQENMKDLAVFMDREGFRKNLQEEALSYYEYKWMKTGGTDYRSILKLCDQITLRTDAILHVYGPAFHKCPILKSCDPSLLRLLGRAVHSVYYRAGMTVIERDDVIAELYFVDYGMMEGRDPEDDDLIATKMPRGSMFGNLDNKDTVVSPNRFVANTNLHLLMIEGWLFHKILQDFPLVRARMPRFRPNNENYILSSMPKQSAVQLAWSEHGHGTAAIIIVTREGLLQYLHKHDKIMQVILIVVSIISVYGDLYNAAFQDNRPNLIKLLYAMDALFICKIAINYFMPFITEENSESRNALETAKKKYYRGEFQYDFVSVLPIELFCFSFKDRWNAFAWFRLNRFCRVTTIYNNLKLYHERLSINLTATTITATLIWFTLFAHISTCLWYQVGVIHDQIAPNTSWRWNQNKTCLCTDDYICSFYFVMTTFSQNGVGDILPRQQLEVIFTILLMILSRMMYMIYVGEFSNIMNYQFFRCFSFYSQFLELKEFLKYNRVTRNLVKLTHRYTLHLWRTSRGLQVPLFLKEAPPCLRSKLMGAAYMKDLRKHPAFKHCERPFLRHVVGHFKPFTYDDDMYVVREGEITNSMYFVHKGSIQESEDEEGNTQIYEIGEFFGTIQGLFRETPYTYSYKTLTKSQVLTLSLDDWEYLLKHFPENKQTIYKPHKGYSKDKKRVISMSFDAYMAGKRKAESKLPEEGAESPGIGDPQDDTEKTTKRTPTIRFGQESIKKTKLAEKEDLNILTASSVTEVATAAAARSVKGSTTSVYSDDITLMNRRTTVLDIEKQTKNIEQDSESLNSKDSRHAIDLYVKSQAFKPPSAESSNIISPWPLDSRRKFSLQETAAIEAGTSKDTHKIRKSNLSKRKSTVLDIDRAVTDKKPSSGEEDNSPQTTDNSRRKTAMNIDKREADRKLATIEDFLTPPEHVESEMSVEMLSSPRQKLGISEPPVVTEKTGKFKPSLETTEKTRVRKSFIKKVKGITSKSSLKRRPKVDGKDSLMMEEDEATTKALLRSLKIKSPGLSRSVSFTTEAGKLKGKGSDEKENKEHRHASAITFKDDVTTVVIPDDVNRFSMPPLEKRRDGHSSEAEVKKDAQPPESVHPKATNIVSKTESPSKIKPLILEKSPTKVLVADDIELTDMPSSAIDITTLKIASVESITSDLMLPQQNINTENISREISARRKPEKSLRLMPEVTSSMKPKPQKPEVTFSHKPEPTLAQKPGTSLSVKPEASPSEKAEASPSVKAEASPSVKPEVSSSVKPEASPIVTPEAPPSVKPEAFLSVKAEASPSVKAEASPSVKPKASSSVKPEASPSVKAEASPSVKPEASPSVTLEVPPNVKPEASPSVKPEASPSVKPEASPSVKLEEASPSVKPEGALGKTPEKSPNVKLEASPSVKPAATLGKTPAKSPSVTLEASPSFKPEDTLGKAPEKSTSVKLEAFSSVKSEATLGKTPEKSPSAKLEASPSVKPEVTLGKTPDKSPSLNLEASPSVKPEVTRGKTPEKSPSVKLEASPSVKSEATLGKTPEKSPSVKPEATLGKTPEKSPSVKLEASPSVKPEATLGKTPEKSPSVKLEASPSVKPEEESSQKPDESSSQN